MEPSKDHKQVQRATLPPAQPAYILRGHASAVNSLHFMRGNSRLLSGDADGFVVIWDLAIKRPVATWQAHQGSILGLGTWGPDKVLTHGRDSHLRCWSLLVSEEKQAGFSTVLPVEDAAAPRKQPWLLHSLEVSTLNFCSFATCSSTYPTEDHALIIAVPGSNDAEVELYSLPSQEQVGLVSVPDQSQGKTGMVMALRLVRNPQDDQRLHIAVGYENGRVVLFRRATPPSTSGTPTGAIAAWEEYFASSAHSQPVLGLDVAVVHDSCFTSGADAIIAQHPLFNPNRESAAAPSPSTFNQTKHAGQQGLAVRSDGRIFATAGWDGRVRVYSSKSLKELAVLKWHKDGVYSVAFASLASEDTTATPEDVPKGRVAAAREQKTRETHWLAAGGKDGKISLWDIY